MRIVLVLGVAAALAACETTQTDPATVSNFDICAHTMRGGQNAVVADAEARRRGLDCRPYYGAILQKRQQEAAANAAMGALGVQMMRGAQPAISCRSTSFIPGVVNTTCN